MNKSNKIDRLPYWGYGVSAVVIIATLIVDYTVGKDTFTSSTDLASVYRWLLVFLVLACVICVYVAVKRLAHLAGMILCLILNFLAIGHVYIALWFTGTLYN